jgi:hypothetical protein
MECFLEKGSGRLVARITWRDVFMLIFGRELDTKPGAEVRVTIRLGRFPSGIGRGLTATQRRRAFIKRIK